MSNLATIKIKVATAVDKIGKTNGTAPPPSIDNRANIAHEYFIASTIASICEKRKEAAKKAAQEAGILGEDYVAGETRMVYDNETMTIAAKTNNPAERLDAKTLRVELIKELGEAKADKIIAASTKSNKPATSFEFIQK